MGIHLPMFQRPAPRHTVTEEGIVPMVNVVFLLLLFFVVAGNINPQKDVNVRPPESQSRSTAPNKAVELVLDANARLWYGGRGLSIRQLSGLLQGSEATKDEIQLTADGQAAAGTVVEILGVLTRGGVERVTLTTIYGSPQAAPYTRGPK